MSAYNERIAHLGFIQKSIMHYEMHSMLAKGASLAVTAGAFYAHMVGGSNSTFALLTLGAAFMLVILWLFDAKYQQGKDSFAKLYEQARTNESVDFNMNADKYRNETSMTKALWATPTSWLYMGQVVAVAVLSFL